MAEKVVGLGSSEALRNTSPLFPLPPVRFQPNPHNSIAPSAALLTSLLLANLICPVSLHSGHHHPSLTVVRSAIEGLLSWLASPDWGLLVGNVRLGQATEPVKSQELGTELEKSAQRAFKMQT